MAVSDEDVGFIIMGVVLGMAFILIVIIVFTRKKNESSAPVVPYQLVPETILPHFTVPPPPNYPETYYTIANDTSPWTSNPADMLEEQQALNLRIAALKASLNPH